MGNANSGRLGLPQNLVAKIRLLLRAAWSLSATARELRIDRGTVARYRDHPEAQGHPRRGVVCRTCGRVVDLPCVACGTEDALRRGRVGPFLPFGE